MKDGCLPAGAQRRITCKNRKWGQVAGKRINELEDKLRGKIKQQIDPAFSVTKTDVQFPVSEEAVSKTSILNSHAPIFQTKMCSVITSGGGAVRGTLRCACVLLPAHGGFKTCHSARTITLFIALHGRKAKLCPKMTRVTDSVLC